MSQPERRRGRPREVVLIDLAIALILITIVTTSTLLGWHLLHHALHQ